MNKRLFIYNFGNLLILFGIVLLVFTYLPFLSWWIDAPVNRNTINKSFSLYIPKINAYAPIIENVDPWNERIYNKSLEKGVAHAKGSSFPGQEGTMFLFAHSSQLPWKLTRLNTAFLRLNEVSLHDTIEVYRDGKLHTYTVFDKKIVWPDQIQYLQNNKTMLILQTCYPLGTSLQRLLVFAR